MAEAQPSADRYQRIVLFDGVCGFCDATVRWLMERDPSGRLHYAPLQGELAATLRSRHAEIPDDIDTLVYVERQGGDERVHLRWDAVQRICAQLEPPPAWLPWLAWLPVPLAELGYRLFARLRYRLFGKLDECRIPSASERSRFLD